MASIQNDENGQSQILQIMRNISGNSNIQRDQSTLSIISQYLAKTKLFQSIADESDYGYILKETALILKYQRYKYGDFLFHQGERGDNLYFVLSGQGSVYIPKEEYELKSEMIYHQKIDQIELDMQKANNQEQKNALRKQIEQIKSQNQSRSNSEVMSNTEQIEETIGDSDEKQQKKLVKFIENSKISNLFLNQDEDDVSILALHEKHHPRYFRISKEFSMYKRVRFERYLDYFGELAAEEQFNRRMASVVASSKNEDFEVAYISLEEFKQIFTNVLEKLYLIQNTLCDQLINCSKKQTINFSYLFNEFIKLERGQQLFSEGTPVNGIFIVRKGSISIKKTNSESKQLLQLAILSQKDIFGHEDAFKQYYKQTNNQINLFDQFLKGYTDFILSECNKIIWLYYYLIQKLVKYLRLILFGLIASIHSLKTRYQYSLLKQNQQILSTTKLFYFFISQIPNQFKKNQLQNFAKIEKLANRQFAQLFLQNIQALINFQNKQYSPDLTRTISAVSEGYGTEVSFAKIDDVFAFLQNHKDFEKELKRKSELKINFYKKRIANVEQVFKSNSQIYNQKEKRNYRVKIEDDQATIFNKFLLNSRDKIATQEDKSTIRSTSNFQQVSKLLEKSASQIVDAGSILLKVNKIQQQQSGSKSPLSSIDKQLSSKRQQGDSPQAQVQLQVGSTTSSFKGRSNLRTRSLVNIKNEISSESYNNLIAQYGNSENPARKSRVTILENSKERPITISTDIQQQQQQTQQKSLKLSRQTTFSQHSVTKGQSTLNNIEEIKPFSSNNSTENIQSELSIGKTHQLQRQMSKKLKDAIAGQWNAKPENWSVDQIEKQVKLNSEKLSINQSQNQNNSTNKQGDNKQPKITYLHNDMDSFEHAKKFVILKRQNKRTQYLHQISQGSISGQNTVENYKKQQQAKEQKAQSPINSPLAMKYEDKFSKADDEDSFFNPHVSIQKFTRFIQSQQSAKSIDTPTHNEIPSLTKVNNTLGRFSLSDINSPLSKSQAPTLNQMKPHSQQKHHRMKSNSKHKQEDVVQIPQQEDKKKVVQLRKCQSTIINSHIAYDISEDFNEELQTSVVQQDNFEQSKVNVPKLQLNIQTKRLSTGFEEYDKPKVPRIAFDQIQQNDNVDSSASKSLSKDQIEYKNIKNIKESTQKGFFLNLTQSPIQKIFDQNSPLYKAFGNSTPSKKIEFPHFQLKSAENTPSRARLNSNHVAFSGIDLDENNQEDKQSKYFINSNYSQIHGSYSPMIIQKLESSKQNGNISSFIQTTKQQISFAYPSSTSTTQVDKQSSTEGSSQQVQSVKNGRVIQLQNTSMNQSLSNQNNSQIINKNVKSQINAYQNISKLTMLQKQKLSPTKLTSSNCQIPISSIQKQLMNQNNNLLKNHLLNQLPKPTTANPQNNDLKINKIEEGASPIHHSSLSPTLRKTNFDRIHSSFKVVRNSFSNSINTQSQQTEKEYPQSGSLSPRQQQFKITKFQTESNKRFSLDSMNSSKDEFQSNHKSTNPMEQSYHLNTSQKDSKINISAIKIFQGISPQNPTSQNGLTVLKKSLFNKEEQSKGTLLSNVFPQKNKTISSKQKSQESLREELSSPQKSLLNLKKRKNILSSNKYSQNQFQQITESPQSIINQQQLFAITPYQPNSTLSSPSTLLPKYLQNLPQSIYQQQ